MIKRIGAIALSLFFLSAIAAPPAFSQAAQPAKKETKASSKQAKPRTPTPGQMAFRERQKKCAAEWKEAKAAGKVEKGMKWPRFLSQCNKRLKGQGT